MHDPSPSGELLGSFPAHIDQRDGDGLDLLWYLSKRGPDGERTPSKRHGRGKRWRMRYVDDSGQPRSELYEKEW